MMTFIELWSVPSDHLVPFTDQLRLAVAAYLTGQPIVERGRVDAAGQGPQLGQGVLGATVGGADQVADRGEIGLITLGAELVQGHAQVHRQGRQPDLRAVVQVALQAP